jgi:choline dehydrogenase
MTTSSSARVLAVDRSLPLVCVLLLEAGLEGGTDVNSDSDDYAVPTFHGRATEDPATSWQFFVRHYEDIAQQERDPKYVAEQDGVFYPRAATVGGCTAHVMITVYPHDADWDDIAASTGDETWRSDAMRKYFERLEACGYRRVPWKLPTHPFLAALVVRIPWLRERYRNSGRHGFGDGCAHHLPTSCSPCATSRCCGCCSGHPSAH